MTEYVSTDAPTLCARTHEEMVWDGFKWAHLPTHTHCEVHDRAKPDAKMPLLACAETIWDGPYRMTCSYLIVQGRCIRHGAGGKTYEVPADSPAAKACGKE